MKTQLNGTGGIWKILSVMGMAMKKIVFLLSFSCCNKKVVHVRKWIEKSLFFLFSACLYNNIIVPLPRFNNVWLVLNGGKQ